MSPPANSSSANNSNMQQQQQQLGPRSGGFSAAPTGGSGNSGIGQLVRSLLTREHALDWAVVILLFCLLGATDAPMPKKPYLLKAQLPELAHPLLPNSVPAWSVPLLAVVAPLVGLSALSAVMRRPSEGLLLGLSRGEGGGWGGGGGGVRLLFIIYLLTRPPPSWALPATPPHTHTPSASSRVAQVGSRIDI